MLGKMLTCLDRDARLGVRGENDRLVSGEHADGGEVDRRQAAERVANGLGGALERA
jgi:hypothetical protein